MNLPRIKINLSGYPFFGANKLIEFLRKTQELPEFTSRLDDAAKLDIAIRVSKSPGQITLSHLQALHLLRFLHPTKSDIGEYSVWAYHVEDLIHAAEVKAKQKYHGIKPYRDTKSKHGRPTR
jgi:hypothetical protein